jgi:MFS family permease
MRALTSAILFFVLNMIGLGLGPLLTGLLSDLLQPAYGDESLRYAMVITALIGSLGMLLFYLGARRLPQDLARA